MDFKVIETEYKGYRFRSRLEARWAVFFDACGVKWEYEPDGYKLGDGVLYLPDFLLHDITVYKLELQKHCDVYVEVKGDMREGDSLKIEAFSASKPILVVSKIPDGKTIWELVDSMKYLSNEMNPPPFNFATIDRDFFGAYPAIDKQLGFGLYGDDVQYLSNLDEGKTVDAYNAARMARFEHGEKG